MKIRNRNPKKIMYHGFLLMFTGFLFACAETVYFGSNYLPESNSELICDIMALIITLFGAGVFISGMIRRIKEIISHFK